MIKLNKLNDKSKEKREEKREAKRDAQPRSRLNRHCKLGVESLQIFTSTHSLSF